MMRMFHLIAVGVLVASALYAYSIKYETTYSAEQVVKLKAAIQREHDGIAVALAEWQRLNRPDRLQAMADRTLDLQTLRVQQIVRLSDVPQRQEDVDMIGRKLDSLGLGSPSEAPDTLPTSSLGALVAKTASSKTPSLSASPPLPPRRF